MYKPTAEQKAKAQARREQFQQLASGLKMMSRDEMQAIASQIEITTCEGHELSAGNKILITYQRENVTIVGGFNQWKAQGRIVRKGEHALSIWIPAKPKADPNKKAGETSGSEDEIFFIVGSVFDITQTEAAA